MDKADLVSNPKPFPASALPVQLTGFVGRDKALETVRQLMAASRLLTLTGAGGSGKTRLALEAVTRVRDANEAEVAWIELASLADAAALARHIALAFDVRIEGGGSAEQALVALLRSRPLILVLDNCEHLVDECARLVELLLHACPDLRVLATSREALGIGGERAWLVPALSLPPEHAGPKDAADAESVRLFAERAREVLTDFALTASNVGAVAQICRRLDGLPLAIELAAARSNVLTPDEIAERLDDRFRLLSSRSRTALPRHRTLRAAVDWSYELLSAEERLLLMRLSVFAGGFTLDAAEQICAGGAIPESQVLDLLAALASRSLVTMQEAEGRARYRLLETIRDYAAARCRERHDDVDVSERHAAWFVTLARQLEPELILGRPDGLKRMDVEHDNVRAALAWSRERNEGARYGLPLAWAAMWYWFHRQLWHEGFRHFEAALDTAVEPDPECRAAALHGMGIFGLYAAHPDSGERLIEAERLWRAAGNGKWLAFTLLCRTVDASLRREPAEARRLAEEAVAVARGVGDAWIEALATVHALVPVLLWEREWSSAEQHLIEAERVYRVHGYSIGIAYALDALAYVALQLGNRARAVSLACASLRADPQNESRWLAGRSLRILGAVAFSEGELARAARLFGAADGMYDAIGARSLTAERHAVNELPERLRAAMPPEAFAAQWRAGRESNFRAAIELALAAEHVSDREVAAVTAPPPADDVAPSLPDAAARPPPPSAPPGGERARTSASVASVPTRDPPGDGGGLTVKALGRLDILRAGEPDRGELLRHARPRELLLYLLAHPGGRTREQIGLDFWPDASAAQVKNNFHVTLHHLRKALGDGAVIVYEQGRYRVSADAGFDFDAARFEDGSRRALRRLRRSGADDGAGRSEAAEAARELAAALSCYRGPFLDGENVGDWHVEIRERLARLHEEALDALAAYHEANAAHAPAVDVLARLVATDPLREDAVRRLMRALVRDGRRAQALRAYERLESELAAALGVPPERDSARLAERVRSGDAV